MGDCKYERNEGTVILRYKFVAQDQFNNIVWIKKYPRKELMEWAGKSHAERMYVGRYDGIHIGYVIGKHWFAVMRLEPL